MEWAALRGEVLGGHLPRWRSSTMSRIACVAPPCICRPRTSPECKFIFARAPGVRDSHIKERVLLSILRRFYGIRQFADQHLVNPVAVHIHNFVSPAIGFEMVGGRWDASKLQQNKASQRGIGIFILAG
jgi:hypothetical protein